MYKVSKEYKDAIYADSLEVKGKVVFEIVDVTAAADATVSTFTSASQISRMEQIVNSKRLRNAKYGSLEPDYFKLDSTFVLPPTVSEAGYEVGWESYTRSQVTNYFLSAILLTIQFAEQHSSIGLTITFEPLTNEYAEEFEVVWYNASNAIIHTETITGNTLAMYELRQNVGSYKKITLQITKWCKPYRRARVTEIDFGIIETNDDETLINMSIVEDIDTLSNKSPSNELQFTLENQDKRFNIINPDGIYPYLQRRQRITPSVGVVKVDGNVEFVPLGTYYLIEPKADEGTLTATFIARDILDILDQSTYKKSVIATKSLYDLAVEVLSDALVVDYEIDTALQSIFTNNCLPLISHREALQLIALAGKAILCSDRLGNVVIKQLSNIALDEIIDLDSAYQSPSIKLEKLVNRVEVTVNTYVAQAASAEINKSIVNIIGTSDVWIEYSNAPCQSVNATVSGGTLKSATYYANAARLTIQASGNVEITATGTILDKSISIYALDDINIPPGEQPIPIKIDNTLVSNSQVAENIASWTLFEANKRLAYEIAWNGDPSIEVGDIVAIEDEFGENKNVRITKQEFEYQGYISTKTKGRA